MNTWDSRGKGNNRELVLTYHITSNNYKSIASLVLNAMEGSSEATDEEATEYKQVWYNHVEELERINRHIDREDHDTVKEKISELKEIIDIADRNRERAKKEGIMEVERERLK